MGGIKHKPRFPRSMRKHIRKEKARFRRQLSPLEAQRAIDNMMRVLSRAEAASQPSAVR